MDTWHLPQLPWPSQELSLAAPGRTAQPREPRRDIWTACVPGAGPEPDPGLGRAVGGLAGCPRLLFRCLM